MLEDQKEMKQLDAGWKVVLLIWWAIVASLGVYLVVCNSLEKNLQVSLEPGFPLETLKYALFGVSFITLVAVHFLRTFLLKSAGSSSNARELSVARHPALGKYTTVVIVTSVLLESIGIYGVVLFLLAKDTTSLHQLLIISAAGMLYFRPRKKELLDLAAQMKTEHNR